MIATEQAKTIYWRRELPPLDAEHLGRFTLEVNSRRVPDTIARRDELWNQCNDDLMVHTRERLTEEVSRLGGRYAHVLNESINTTNDAAAGEVWLHGRFTIRALSLTRITRTPSRSEGSSRHENHEGRRIQRQGSPRRRGSPEAVAARRRSGDSHHDDDDLRNGRAHRSRRVSGEAWSHPRTRAGRRHR